MFDRLFARIARHRRPAPRALLDQLGERIGLGRSRRRSQAWTARDFDLPEGRLAPAVVRRTPPRRPRG